MRIYLGTFDDTTELVVQREIVGQAASMFLLQVSDARGSAFTVRFGRLLAERLRDALSKELNRLPTREPQ